MLTRLQWFKTRAFCLFFNADTHIEKYLAKIRAKTLENKGKCYCFAQKSIKRECFDLFLLVKNTL